MPTDIPIADAIQSGAGLVDTALGLIKQGQINKNSRRLAQTRPQYQISPLAGQDLSMAESELANNSSAGEDAYNKLNNGQFSSSINAVLKSGGTPNDIGSIYGNNEDGRLKLAMMTDNLRLNRINNYVRANQAMQDAQQTQWQVNKWAPWADEAQANAMAKAGASQQISQGLNTFTGGLMNGVNSIQEDSNLTLPKFNAGTPDPYVQQTTPVGKQVTQRTTGGNLVPMTFPSFNQ